MEKKYLSASFPTSAARSSNVNPRPFLRDIFWTSLPSIILTSCPIIMDILSLSMPIEAAIAFNLET